MKLKGNLYSEDYMRFDVDEGVVKNRTGTRLLALNEDFLRGFRKALIEETGEAHHVVFETCGKTFGENLAKRFDKEIFLHYEVEASELPMSMFSLLFKNFWERHGWGVLHIDWEQGFHTGIFEVKVENPAFSNIFGAEEGLNDDVFVGVLGGFFSRFSGQELKAYQTAEQRTGQDSVSQFVMGTADRLNDVPDMVLSQKSHEQILETLRA